uniref:Beta-microseminoprotein n=1 Tax=Oryctolagus cuniculus TaxID=9986 RepID=G1U5Y1_RABIT
MPSTMPSVPKWQSLLEPKTHASGPEVDSLPSSVSDDANTLLGSLVVFTSLLVLCNTQCYVKLYDKNPEDPPDECRDLDGVTHKLNVEWKTENCYTCSCDETGIHCCNTAAIPGGFDTTKCKTIFHKNTCSYSVVELENPDKECPVSSWIL